MIVDILPTLARLLFLGRLKGMRLSYLQVAILLATGIYMYIYMYICIYIYVCLYIHKYICIYAYDQN
jgi:hypothetical protein